jgi:hypothetical protein
MRQMGFSNRSILSKRANSTVCNHSTYKGGKLSLITKSNLVKVTVEEINSIRPSVYKYLLP